MAPRERAALGKLLATMCRAVTESNPMSLTVSLPSDGTGSYSATAAPVGQAICDDGSSTLGTKRIESGKGGVGANSANGVGRRGNVCATDANSTHGERSPSEFGVPISCCSYMRSCVPNGGRSMAQEAKGVATQASRKAWRLLTHYEDESRAGVLLLRPWAATGVDLLGATYLMWYACPPYH